jgi:uncharacterized cysteine cluster protein YcgN (CxxCxxCC family)
MKRQKGAKSSAWEDICDQCGRCCYEKLEYRGKIFYTTTPCPHLDRKTRLCRIYSSRFSRYPECTQLTPELAQAGILPADCPYAALYAADQPAGQKKKR